MCPRVVHILECLEDQGRLGWHFLDAMPLMVKNLNKEILKYEDP